MRGTQFQNFRDKKSAATGFRRLKEIEPSHDSTLQEHQQKRSVKVLLMPSHKHPKLGQWSLQRVITSSLKRKQSRPVAQQSQSGAEKRISTLGFTVCFSRAIASVQLDDSEARAAARESPSIESVELDRPPPPSPPVEVKTSQQALAAQQRAVAAHFRKQRAGHGTGKCGLEKVLVSDALASSNADPRHHWRHSRISPRRRTAMASSQHRGGACPDGGGLPFWGGTDISSQRQHRQSAKILMLLCTGFRGPGHH